MMAAKMIVARHFVLTLVLLLTQASYAGTDVVTIGTFSNQRQSVSDDPHIEGYSLTLYREREIVFGRFCWATGIEVPCAPIQKAAIDRRGVLTFQVMLSIGQEISKDTPPEGRPAYRVVSFRGKIGKNSIPGVLSIKSDYGEHSPTVIERIKLKRIPFKGSAVSSYQEWVQTP